MPAPPFASDWQIGARDRDDFWVRAERFIAQRVSGQVDRELEACSPSFHEIFKSRNRKTIRPEFGFQEAAEYNTDRGNGGEKRVAS
jgi:hypothetical protein